MNNPNRATQIAKLQKILKKHYKPISTPQRLLLEHLLYACCLENAPFEKADEAFARLQQTYFDWNEVRVTSANELAELFHALPQPLLAAQRIKKVLQGMFDATFTFDLEPLKKQNLGKTVKDLEKFGATPFALAYVTQHALNGHAIAADEGTFDILVISGIITDADAAKGLIPGIERAVPKNKGHEFFSELHQFGTDYYTTPNSTRIKGILAELVPDLKERLAARGVKKQELAVEHAKAAAKERERERKAQAEMMNPTKPAVPKPGKEPLKDKHGKPIHVEPAKDAGKDAKAKAGKAPEKPSTEKAKPAKKPEPEAVKKKSEPPKIEVKKKAPEALKKPVGKGLTKKKPK
jgi:endonuclease-3